MAASNLINHGVIGEAAGEERGNEKETLESNKQDKLPQKDWKTIIRFQNAPKKVRKDIHCP